MKKRNQRWMYGVAIVHWLITYEGLKELIKSISDVK